MVEDDRPELLDQALQRALQTNCGAPDATVVFEFAFQRFQARGEMGVCGHHTASAAVGVWETGRTRQRRSARALGDQSSIR